MSMPTPNRASRATSLLLLFAAVVAMLGLVVTAAPAGAHGDEGEMTVLAVEPAAEPNTVRLEIGLVYANDDELAEEATVTAMLTGPSGESVGPVSLPRITGSRYGAEAAVPVPGSWTVVITSTGPDTESEPQVVDVAAEAPTTSTIIEAPESSNPMVPNASGASATEAESDDSSPLVIIVVIAVAVILVVAVLYVVLRRRGAVR